jgi:hypothetical protein
MVPYGSGDAVTIDVPSSAGFGGDEMGTAAWPFWLISYLFFPSVLPPVSLDLSLLLARCRRLAPCRLLIAKAMAMP